MRQFFLSLVITIICVGCSNPYKEGFEDATYEVTSELTGRTDTIVIRTPKNSVIQATDNRYSKFRYIWTVYPSTAACPIYINGHVFYGLEGVGTVKKLQVIHTSLSNESHLSY